MKKLEILMSTATTIYCEIDGSTPESAARDALSLLREILTQGGDEVRDEEGAPGATGYVFEQ